jgi:hypothetical protein
MRRSTLCGAETDRPADRRVDTPPLRRRRRRNRRRRVRNWRGERLREALGGRRALVRKGAEKPTRRRRSAPRSRMRAEAFVSRQHSCLAEASGMLASRLERNAYRAGSVVLPGLVHGASDAHAYDHWLVISPQGSNYSLFWVGRQSAFRRSLRRLWRMRRGARPISRRGRSECAQY